MPVAFRDNFDVTVKEPTVLPTLIPNLLINGASGIAVGMATNIPPHNLRDIVKGVIEVSLDPEISISKLVGVIKGPDFPTGCLVLNTKRELEAMYSTGRGSIRMRGEWRLEEVAKSKRIIVIESIPYGISKSVLVEQIADLIIARKVPQLVDVRDESTTQVRVVLELASGADPDLAMAYLLKHTALESQFAMNLTALVPTKNGGLVPELCDLKRCLVEFLKFREEVTRRKLNFELLKLRERVEILNGLEKIFDALDEALKIIRESQGRADSVVKLIQRFKLTENQAEAVVDMRVYQLSRTSIAAIRDELKVKNERMTEIKELLSDAGKISDFVRKELAQVVDKFGDKRKSKLIKDEVEEVTLNQEDFLVKEDVYAILTRDGWIKRVRRNNELSSVRTREGDEVRWVLPVSTLDSLLMFTNLGNLYTVRVHELSSSSGFGDPVQELRRFKDDEQVIKIFAVGELGATSQSVLAEGSLVFIVTALGQGSVISLAELGGIKRSGRRFGKLRDGDEYVAVIPVLASAKGDAIVFCTRKGVVHKVALSDFPRREGVSIGVIAMDLADSDRICGAFSATGSATLVSGQKKMVLEGREVSLGRRGLKGTKLKGLSGVDKLEDFTGEKA